LRSRIVTAIRLRKPHVSLGLAETFYAALNALAPKVIDNGLRPQIARARAEFSQTAIGEPA
jgi:hypothetical protein